MKALLLAWLLLLSASANAQRIALIGDTPYLQQQNYSLAALAKRDLSAEADTGETTVIVVRDASPPAPAIGVLEPPSGIPHSGSTPLPGWDPATLHQVDMALAHFPRILGLRDGRLQFDLPTAQVGRERLEALYAQHEDELRGEAAERPGAGAERLGAVFDHVIRNAQEAVGPARALFDEPQHGVG